MSNNNFNTPKPKALLLYADTGAVFRRLSARRAGLLIKAIYDYWETGKIPTDETIDLLSIPIRAHIDRDNRKYQSRSEKNRENISAYWSKLKKSEAKNDTNEYDRIRLNTIATNEKEKEIEIENVKGSLIPPTPQDDGEFIRNAWAVASTFTDEQRKQQRGSR